MPRNAMILFAAITIGTVVATDALAAGRGGGGGFGGGHIGAASSGGHIGAAFGGGPFGGGFVNGRTAGDHLGGHRGVFLGNPGGSSFHGTRMSDGFHDGNHRFRERFSAGLYSYFPDYSDYGYDGLGYYTGDTACFQYQHVYTTAGWRWRHVWACN
jgi:hypothetical protein